MSEGDDGESSSSSSENLGGSEIFTQMVENRNGENNFQQIVSHLDQPSVVLCCFADTHLLHNHMDFSSCIREELVKCSLVVNAGDFTYIGKGLSDFNKWSGSGTIGSFPSKRKIAVKGNHENIFLMRGFYPSFLKQLMLSHFRYLEDTMISVPFNVAIIPQSERSNSNNSTTIDSLVCTNKVIHLNVFGGGYYKRKNWRGVIPPDSDIVVTHSPPSGFHDITWAGISRGSKSLLEELRSLPPSPNLVRRIHISGHVHESNGVLSDDQSDTVYCACASTKYVSNERKTIVRLPLCVRVGVKC